MRPYPLEIEAGKEKTIDVDGNFLTVLDSNNPLTVTMYDDNGQHRQAYMRVADINEDQPEHRFNFKKVTVKNEGSTTAIVKIQAGFGKFKRAASQVSEPAPPTSALNVGTTITLQLTDAVLVSGNNYKVEKTIAANSSRKKITFQVLDYFNTEGALKPIGLGSGMMYDNTSGNNTGGNGIQLEYGTIYTLEHSGALTFATPNKMDAGGLITISYLEYS